MTIKIESPKVKFSKRKTLRPHKTKSLMSKKESPKVILKYTSKQEIKKPI